MTSLEDRPTVAIGATGLLRVFNEAGVLGLADVHTAAAVGRMCGESDDTVRLALALAVRALRLGSVCVQLDAVATSVYDEAEQQVDISALPWPVAGAWVAACRRSAAVAVGADAASGRPLRLVGDLLYLERYWQQEEVVRLQLQARQQAAPPSVDGDRFAAGLTRLFGPAPQADSPGARTDQQREAAVVSATSWVTVIAGGPGTGKTSTVARLLALLRDQPGPSLRVALAAPTGKAAARLEEAVSTARADLPAEDQDRLGDLHAVTLHRLLGWQPHARGRFRHHAGNHLPYDVVVIDEMSMVSLTLMARLLEAVRPSARLVLAGDPDQLSSVEAGAVLADITGAPAAAPKDPGGAVSPGSSRGLGEAVVRLRHTWRFGGAIGELAEAIRSADPDATVAVLRAGGDGIVFVPGDPNSGSELPELAAEVRRTGSAVRAAAAAGDVSAALSALDEHRLLCAHRRGPYGVSRWSREAERWLTEAMPGYADDGEWYLGRPVMVTANDYELQLYNGDTGVVVATEQGQRVAFLRGAEPALVPPVRLDAVQTLHAMTVHRAQGSQFRTVSVVLPPADSPLLTRELLYTAVTRARHRVQVFGTEEAIRRAVNRPANRASGLRHRL